MSRPRPSLADYVAIAISPALIMFLVGSLIFFLIEVFYQGGFSGRLQWIMAMFVMGAVSVARISIEEGREYATLFALPLAIVTAIATFRFVEFTGPLSPIGGLLNLGLIALIWWSTDRLTWDCTVLEKDADASNEGLLQTVGLEGDNGQTQSRQETEQHADPVAGLWRKFVEHRRRPHAPGVWVVYFSLAALPIFGFGQAFIRGDDLDTRRYVFKLLVVYVATALGLLVSTSFVGLRRYLRKRQVEMPAEMAGTWVAAGVALIVAALLFCLMLPRRNPEYSLTHLKWFATSPADLSTSKWALGNEGLQQEDADRSGNAAKGQDEQRQGAQQGQGQTQGRGGQQQGQQGSPTQQGQGQQGQGQQGQGQQGQGQQGQGQQGQGQQGQGQGQQGRSGQSQSGQRGSGQQSQQSQQQGQQQPGRQGQQGNQEQGSGGENDRGERAEETNSDAGDKRGTSFRGEGRQTQTQPQSPSASSSRGQRSFSPGRLLGTISSTFGRLLRWFYWLIVIVVVGYLLWRYYEQVSKAVRDFVELLRDFWQRLFGGAPKEVETVADAAPPAGPPPRPFADFADPFAAGRAEGYSAAQLVRYSFEAFEAWGRERGVARAEQQTPHEFARLVGRRQRGMVEEAARLAELYSWCAYGTGELPPNCREQLRGLWRRMKES